MENGIKAIAEGMGKTPELVFKLSDEGTAAKLSRLGEIMEMVYKVIPRTINLPKVFNIEGTVEVTKSPATEVKNFKELEKYFDNLSTQVKMLARAISSIPQARFEPQINVPQTQLDLEPLRQAILAMPREQKAPKIEFPKIDIPKPEKLDITPVVEAVHELEAALAKKTDGDSVAVLRNVQKGIEALVNRPIMTPQPVTNVNLNALQGFTKTTAATIGTIATSLPGYGQLFNRRSVIIYNNSSNTIFIGGSDVTTSNGLPVAAGTFSPSIDAGYNLIIYGVAASGGNDARVLEISKTKEADVQG